MNQPQNLKTVSQFVEHNPAFTVGGIRWIIFHEQENGLKEAQAIIRLGRKVMIDSDRFFDWLYSQNQSQRRVAE
jgi:hypothetical protein